LLTGNLINKSSISLSVLERLLYAKPHIQNKGPEIPYFMKYKLSQKELLKVKERKRCYENGIIFSRLLEIDKSASPYSIKNQPAYCPAFDKKKHYFDKLEKLRDLTKENQFLFSRLVSERSYYPSKLHFNINDLEWTKYILEESNDITIF